MNWLFARDPRPHHDYVTPAVGRAEVWRLLFGLVLIAGIYLVLSQIVFDTLFSLMPPEQAARFADNLNAGSTPGGMFALLFQFGLLALATAIVCIALHRRRPLTLLGPVPLFLRQFFAVFAAMIALMLIVWVLPPWSMGDHPYRPNMPPGLWVLLLPVSLAAVLVQSATEEIVFRGYVQQQLAARFRSPLVWMVVPSALFAAGHYIPELAGENALPIAVWAGVFGLMMADLTARSGTLGPAIAVHFVNNISALLITALPDDMSGLALYVAPFGLEDEAAMAAWLPVDFGMMLVSWLAARLVLRR